VTVEGFGDLRALLEGEPCVRALDELCDVIAQRHVHDPEIVEEQWVPYCQEKLAVWPLELVAMPFNAEYCALHPGVREALRLGAAGVARRIDEFFSEALPALVSEPDRVSSSMLAFDILSIWTVDAVTRPRPMLELQLDVEILAAFEFAGEHHAMLRDYVDALDLAYSGQWLGSLPGPGNSGDPVDVVSVMIGMIVEAWGHSAFAERWERSHGGAPRATPLVEPVEDVYTLLGRRAPGAAKALDGSPLLAMGATGVRRHVFGHEGGVLARRLGAPAADVLNKWARGELLIDEIADAAGRARWRFEGEHPGALFGFVGLDEESELRDDLGDDEVEFLLWDFVNDYMQGLAVRISELVRVLDAD